MLLGILLCIAIHQDIHAMNRSAFMLSPTRRFVLCLLLTCIAIRISVDENIVSFLATLTLSALQRE